MSETNVIVDTLRRILIEEMGVSVDPARLADANVLLEDDLGIDSVGLIELIGVIETQFGFEFLDDDLRTSNFRSLASLAEVIEKRTKDEAPAESA